MLSVEALRREIVKMVKKMPGRENNVWKTKPAGWSGDIPFLDPNNIMENGKKPNKVILKKMHEHLKSGEDCQKVELQGSPTLKKATNEVMNAEHRMQKNSAMVKDIVKGTCPQLQEVQKDLQKLSHCKDNKEKASKNSFEEIKNCMIVLRTCCDDVLSELENVRSMRNSLDQPLQVVFSKADHLGIQFRKPENIQPEQECDVPTFLATEDENASPATGNLMAVQTPLATGELIDIQTPLVTGEHMAFLTPHATGEHMAIETPHATGEHMAIPTPHATGEHMAIETPHATGEHMAIPTPHATREHMAIETPHVTGEHMASLTPHATGEHISIQTSHATGAQMTIQAPDATGAQMTIQAPHATGEQMAILTPHATGEQMAVETPQVTGEHMGILTPPATGELVASLTAHTTGEPMTTPTTVGPRTTNLEEVESCNVFDESSNMILMGMLSTIHDAAYGMNHTNSVIVRDDVMWGLSVPSSKLEQDDWLDEAHTAACKHYGCNEEDATFVQEKEIKAQHDSVRTSKRRASLSSDEPNAKRCMSSMRQF